MLGLRGCRLGIIYPEITAMQVRAIFEAACTVAARKGRVMPEVMIPLTASVVEFRKQALIVRQVAEEVFRERQITVPFLLGTMIELPRAALTADELAREAQFFSFGTNDLTQTTWGLSRDDAGHFLPYYLEHGVIEADPFQVLDQAGVGKLIQMACELGRRTRPDLKLGICGEHGGEPAAVAFCDRLGSELRLLLTFPRAHRPAGGRAGRARDARNDGSDEGDGLEGRTRPKDAEATPSTFDFRLIPKESHVRTLVGIVMGSDSDWEVMQHAAAPAGRVRRAPREPRRLRAPHARPPLPIRRRSRGTGAALPHRRRGRRGAPARHARGQDDTARARRAGARASPSGAGLPLSIVQMPAGVPVATFAIGTAGAQNAALYAVAMLALNDAALADAPRRLPPRRRTARVTRRCKLP